MGMKVERVPSRVDFSRAVFEAPRALLQAVEETVLPAAVEGAPYEDEPRHGYHLRDTAYARVAGVTEDTVSVEVGFTAFWSWWQEVDEDYHHETGHAGYLATAVYGPAAEAAFARAAELFREAMGL